MNRMGVKTSAAINSSQIRDKWLKSTIAVMMTLVALVALMMELEIMVFLEVIGDSW